MKKRNIITKFDSQYSGESFVSVNEKLSVYMEANPHLSPIHCSITCTATSLEDYTETALVIFEDLRE